ncbi:MAG: YlmC/YmxH family sporulation protein [Oscillospiraceae bacterium]|nr:YlmC/YmxH family sporulation protein [Oscillospiraceae bacterium]
MLFSASLTEVLFMFRGYSLRQREVVNIATAERLGFISDVEINDKTGNIEAIIVPKHGWLLKRLFGGGELIITWTAIEVVGEDLILVRLFFNSDTNRLQEN